MMKKAQLWSALQVVQGVLEGYHMRPMRVMHVQAHLLNCIRHIRSDKCEVLSGASQTPELGSILHKRSIVPQQLGL
jgi:hypothetical protein